MKLVIDASVALKWVLADKPDERHVDTALWLLDAVDRRTAALIQPVHWTVEILGVVARLDRSRLGATIALLGHLPKQIVESDVINLRAGEMAANLNQHLFDTLYHAVALETGATLLTDDDKYYAKANTLGSIQRLADVNA